MAKINFNLRNPQSSTPDKNKVKTPINLVIRWNNKRLVYPSELSILPQHWENTPTKGKNYQRAKKSLAGYSTFNESLNNLETFVETTFNRFKNTNSRTPNIEELRESLKNAKEEKESKTDLKLTFFGYFDKFIKENESTNEKTQGTISIYKTALNHLREFQRVKQKNQPKYRIDFETIDLDFYHEYFEYLTKTKKFGENNIGKQFKVIKTVLNDATERGVNTNLAFRSKRFKVVSEEADDIYLNESEIKELYKLDLSSNKRLEKVRDLFYIGCWTGLRYSDYNKINSKNIINGDELHLFSKKTKRNIVIPLIEEVLFLKDKYNSKFPRPLSNQKMNEYIKEVCAMVDGLKEKTSIRTKKGGTEIIKNIEKYKLVSIHTGRRSYATNCYKRGIPVSVIKDITDHKTDASFYKYIKITPSEKAQTMKMYLNQSEENTKLKKVI